MKGLCNFKAIKKKSPKFNHCEDREATTTRDGLDPSLPKNNGHDPIVATLCATTNPITIMLKIRKNIHCLCCS